MRKYWFAAAALCCVVFLSGCSGRLKSAVNKGALALSFADTEADSDYLWVRGIAAANPEHSSQTQRRAMSREAAVANAYQRAVEYIKGAAVIANVRVKDAVSQDSTLETKVNGVVRGGEIVSSEYLNDDGCTVILRIPRESLKLIGVELSGR